MLQEEAVLTTSLIERPTVACTNMAHCRPGSKMCCFMFDYTCSTRERPKTARQGAGVVSRSALYCIYIPDLALNINLTSMYIHHSPAPTIIYYSPVTSRKNIRQPPVAVADI